MIRPLFILSLLVFFHVPLHAQSPSGEPAKDKSAKDKETRHQGSLSVLPTAPGPHIARLKTLADNTWLQLGAPAADPKWGLARGRAWGAVMPYSADLKAAFLFGEGVHGWYNKQTNRYMDDLWAYDVNGHRWICLYPGADVKNVALKMNADGFEVDQDGQPIPLAQMAHGYAQVTYDTDRSRFMFMPCPGPDWVIALGERRKSWGGLSKWPYAPANCSPWMYNVATARFELLKVQGVSAGKGIADVFVYLPSIKKTFYYHGGAKDAWLYDAKANAWSRIMPKGPPPPFGLDDNACLDSKRNRIYFGGGYYPVAPGASAFWCYDVESNAWVDLQPKGKPCMGCNRYGPNHAIMHYDSANDVVVLFYHRLPQAPTDGTVNPGARALGVYIYDPASNSWSETPLPLSKESGQCPNGFYDPDLNSHFIHCAGDSADIALGDPVKGLFQLLVTTDGGTNWKSLAAKTLPPALSGEGAFAASGTCLVTHGENDVWFATGSAKTARVFHSRDRGRNWEVSETPIVADVESAGIFSIAFRDKLHGIIVGGDYRKPNDIGATAATTSDGGKTWTSLDKRLPFRSAVAWAKDRWVAVGTSGSHVSLDNGDTWKLLDGENYNSVGFTSTGEGWAVGPKGRIAKFVK